MKYFIIILGILSNALASLLIKYSTTAPRSFPSFSEPIAALTNWPFWAGIFFYGLAFIFYGLSLSRFPLNIAHPIFTAGAIFVVSLFSLIFLKEPFSVKYIFGMVFIFIGVVLITSK